MERTDTSSPRRVATQVDLDDPHRLAAARRLLGSGVGNPVVGHLCTLAARLLGTSSAHVSVVEEVTAVVGGHGAGEWLAAAPPVPRDDSACARVAHRGVPLVVHDAREEDDDLADLLGGASGAARAYLGVPLPGPDGQPVGAVCAYDAAPRAWSAAEVRIVEDVARAVAAELERAAQESERREADRVLHGLDRDQDATLVALLATASDALSASLDPDDAVRSLARLVVPALADWSVVTLLDEQARPRDVEWWHRLPAMLTATEQFARHRLEGRTAAVGSLASLEAGAPYVLESGVLEVARETLRSDAAYDALARLEPTSVVVVPIAGRGRIDGTITLGRSADRAPASSAQVDATLEIGRRASVALGHARDYHRQRRHSEELQRSLLTPPVEPPGTRLEVRYAPAADAADVGGDWYDAFALPGAGPGATASMLVVGDVAGHDVAAAAAMGQVRSIVRGLAVSGRDSPAALLDAVDRALDRLRLDVQATAVVVRLETLEGRPGARLLRASAGHPPAVVLGADGGVELLGGDGVMLGAGATVPRTEETTDLPPGSTLLLFTDGLVERRGEGLDAGIDRLRETLPDLARRPLGELVDRVLGDMVPGGHEDDVALLAIRPDG